MSTHPLLSINRLSFQYNGRSIIHEISFEVNKSESWAIIGKNGAGKSTVIKCIGKLNPIPDNTILVNGKDIHSYTPRALAQIIAYVPQASGRIAPSFTVSDYVMMGRFPYQGFMALPTKIDAEIVNESLDLTDTTHLSDRTMNTLSGGELQRVFLAGAVAQRPELLLLDEPATFLDPLHQELIRKALTRIHQEYGTTMITVTHDINVALTRHTHVAALDHGKLFYSGSTESFIKKCPDALGHIFSLPFEFAKTDKGRTIIVPGVIQ